MGQHTRYNIFYLRKDIMDVFELSTPKNFVAVVGSGNFVEFISHSLHIRVSALYPGYFLLLDHLI